MQLPRAVVKLLMNANAGAMNRWLLCGSLKVRSHRMRCVAVPRDVARHRNSSVMNDWLI